MLSLEIRLVPYTFMHFYKAPNGQYPMWRSIHVVSSVCSVPFFKPITMQDVIASCRSVQRDVFICSISMELGKLLVWTLHFHMTPKQSYRIRDDEVWSRSTARLCVSLYARISKIILVEMQSVVSSHTRVQRESKIVGLSAEQLDDLLSILHLDSRLLSSTAWEDTSWVWYGVLA